MRGRGFGSSMMGGRSDAFRSRAPNTSRPPSMHVDDFEKMKTAYTSAPTNIDAGNRSFQDVSNYLSSGCCICWLDTFTVLFCLDVDLTVDGVP